MLLAALVVFLVVGGLVWMAGNAAAAPPPGKFHGGWQAGPVEVNPERILVRFKDSSSVNTVQAAAERFQALGLQLEKTAHFGPSKRFPRGLDIHIVKVPKGTDVRREAAELSRRPEILYAEPDYKVYRDGAPVFPSDPYFNLMWGLHNPGASQMPPQADDPELSAPAVADADIDMPEGWSIRTDSPEVIVGLIDTGAYVDHPDLAAHIWTNPGEIPDNGIDDDGNGYVDDIHGWDFYDGDNTVWDPDQRDQYGYLADEHGTHTAGTIGALSDNAMGVAGISWDIKIIILKFLGPEGGFTSDAILALQYAAQAGAKLTNNSWGGGAYSQALKDAIEGTGMLFVAAAGNSGTNNDATPHYPSSYDSPNIIAVAATMQNDEPASYPGWWSTCYGATSVDLFAPGGYILSTVPPDPPPGPGQPPEEAYAFFYGTSMATPHVSGVAALVMSQYPTLPLYPGAPGWTEGSPSVKSLILDTVDRKPALAGKCVTGGRLNAANALAASLPPVIERATATPTQGEPPLAVTFEAAAHDVDGSIADMWWDFGDGSAPLHAANAQHTYTAQGWFEAKFHAVDNAGLESVATVRIHVFFPPHIGVNPTSLQASLDWGQEETQHLTITNSGQGDLHYSCGLAIPGSAPAGAAPAIPDLQVAKGQVDPRQGPPVAEGAGGPDHSGYQWADSDAPTGPAFEWLDLTSTGTPVNLGDDASALVDLPFAFPFYGQQKTQVRIGSNGYLTFGTNGDDYSNDPIPNPSQPNDLIAPFWDDLNPGSGSRILYYGDAAAGIFVVEYKNVPRWGSSTPNTFEVILRKDGTVKFQYLTMRGTLNQATVGIENAAGNDGLQVAFNQAYLHDNLAVEFYPFWLAVEPSQGTVAPGASADVAVTFKAGQRPEGDYPATLVVQSDDPDTPAINVEAFLHVNALIPPVIRSFTAQPFAGKTPLTVQFAAEVGDTDGRVVASQWNFGDGSAPVDGGAPSDGQLRTSHTYETEGEYDATLTVIDDEGLRATRTIHIVARPQPSASLTPPSFTAAIRAHRTRTETLTIRNSGDVPLEFTLRAETAGTPAQVVPRVAPDAPDWNGAKDQPDPRPGRLGRGGPDRFGMIWLDSDQPGGPTFEWVDITTTGNRVNLGDDSGVSVDLPWPFPFYGGTYTSLSVCSNGYLTFGSTTGDYSNDPIPDDNTPNNLLAVYWDDLSPNRAGSVYTYHDAAHERFVVEWYQVPLYPNTGALTFEAILYPDGRILYQYGPPEAPLNFGGKANSATVGIENADGSDGLEVVFNAPYVHNGLAVLFYPFAWLSTNVSQGSVAPGASQDVQVLFDLRPIASGSLDGRLVLDSNDLLHPEIAAPVHVDVLPNQPPVITAAGVNPARGPVETQFQFVAAAQDPDGRIADQYWDFGDGSQPVHEFTTTHTYGHEGPYTATFHAVDNDGYEATARVQVEVGQPPAASWDPHQIFLRVAQGRTGSASLTLSNAGPGALRFGAEAASQSIQLPKRLAGPVGRPGTAGAGGTVGAANAGAGGVDPLARTARGLYAPLADQERRAIQPLDAGQILAHWTAPSPITLAWGVAVDRNSGNLAISDPQQKMDALVTPAGAYTGTSWSTPWAGSWPGDMAFDGQFIWQVNVGGDNGIYQLNPQTGAVVASITSGPWTGVSQRGLAYNPDDDTFYIGGWNEDIIYHFKGLSWDHPGEVLEQWSMPVSISGLAYHPGAKILVVASNAAPDALYFVNAESHAIVAQFAHPAGGDYNGAGLEFDANGNLWVASQGNNTMYLVATNLGPIGRWLQVAPASGTVTAGASQQLTVTVDARNLRPGDHSGAVSLATNDPENPQIVVPVQLHVAAAPVIQEATATPTLGEPPLTVQFHAVVQAPETPLASVKWDFGDGSAPVVGSEPTLDASHVYTAEGQFLATFTAVDQLGGTASTQILVDVRNLPRATVDPTQLEFTLPGNGFQVHTVTVGNAQGKAPLQFKVRVRPGASPAIVLPQRIAGGKIADPDALTARGLFQPLTPEQVHRLQGNVRPDGVGQVLLSWPVPSPITLAWGAGFDQTNVWISDPQVKKDSLVTPQGVYTGKTFATPWAGSWPGDMAYDPNHNLIWQVNVGGDNGIYGLDPATGEVRQKITSGPWTGISQRGLAYDAATDTFYIGGWNQDIIYHIRGLSHSHPGEVIEAWSFPVGIAGLAWHPGGILWVSNNGSPDMIFGLDLEHGAVVYQFQAPSGGEYQGAGLELNEDGNLWVVAMNNRAYLVDTDMPISRGIQVEPSSGTIPAGQTQDLAVTVKASELGQPGKDYTNYLEITTNDPFRPLLGVDVNVHILPAPVLSDVKAEPAVGEPPLEVRFSATVQAGAAPVVDVWWDFGDGSAAVHQPTASHVYPNLGTYEASIHAKDANGVEVSQKVQVEVRWLPVLGVTPDAFDVFLTEGQQDQRPLTIRNDGKAPLNFHLALAPSFGETAEYQRFAAERSYRKGDFAKELHGWPVTYGAGGPDAYGYVWMDSDQEGGPAYDWLEISEIGTPVTLDDESGVTVPLPFPFPFYGESKSQVAICSNGYLTFGKSIRGFFENAPIPNSAEPNDILAAFWDDLDPGAAGHVYYYYDEAHRRFIVEFKDVPQWGAQVGYTFQIILKPDGTILYQYQSMRGDLTSATVGIENARGSVGLEVVYNAQYVKDGLAVGFTPIGSLVGVNPDSGQVLPGKSQDVVVTFGSPTAAPGVYHTGIRVMADDPYRPVAVVPVDLTINGIPRVSIQKPAAGSVVEGVTPIQWTARDDQALTVDLAYSGDGGQTWTVLVQDAENSGRYDWDTNGLPVGDLYQVQVTVKDPYGQHATAQSGNFTLHRSPQVELTVPAGGEIVTTPSLEIRWNASDPEDGTELAVALEYSKDGGETWSRIKQNLPNSGSYTWNLAGVGPSDRVQVRITVTDKDRGSTVVVSPQFTVTQAPVAAFTYNHPGLESRGTEEPVRFSDGSHDPDGSVAAWHWDFGDGAASLDQNPQHRYAQGGIYTVQLWVTDNLGARSSTAWQTLVVGSPAAPVTGTLFIMEPVTDGYPLKDLRLWYERAQQPTEVPGDGNLPEIVLTCFGGNPVASHAALFNSRNAYFALQPTEAVAGPDGVSGIGRIVLNWYWPQGMDPQGLALYWFDAATGQWAPVSQQSAVPYRDSSEGGLYGGFIRMEIGPDTSPSLNQLRGAILAAGVSHVAPTAGFSFTPAQPTIQDTVQFRDASQPGDSEVVAWHWDFGDGTTSTEQNPQHRYTTKGSHWVALTVWDSTGAPSVEPARQKVEVVNLPPQVSITAPAAGAVWTGKEAIRWTATDPDDPAESLQIRLAFSADGTHWTEIAAGEANDGTYLWDTAVVPKGGLYQVQVTVTDTQGAKASAVSPVFTIVKLSGLVAAGPNPADRTVTFYFAQGVSGTLYVYDSAGRLAYRHEVAEGETHYLWDLTDSHGTPLAPGLYLYVLVTNSGRSSPVLKLVVER
ncbi:MAG: PKD domain-containing protein [Firmicutes bacterium]|nr:PKD domain-containing protein [Bacillota bacterium]